MAPEPDPGILSALLPKTGLDNIARSLSKLVFSNASAIDIKRAYAPMTGLFVAENQQAFDRIVDELLDKIATIQSSRTDC
mgnify:CR=1 FL=1